MLGARVIPCLDVTAGRVVKGVNFVGLRDAGDPVELAARYDAEGADELVFLDITASSDARETMVDVVARVAEEVFIPFTVGGGLNNADDVRKMLRAGADKVSFNTRAVATPALATDPRQGRAPVSARVPVDTATRKRVAGICHELVTVRTGIPRVARYSLASPTVCWPKWKIEAASTALAPPSEIPS